LGEGSGEGGVRKLLAEEMRAGSRWHRRRNGDDARILARLLDQALGVNLGVRWRIGLGLGLRARRDVELDHTVIFVRRGLGGRITLPLLGHDVKQKPPRLRVPPVLLHGPQMIEVLSPPPPPLIKTPPPPPPPPRPPPPP